MKRLIALVVVLLVMASGVGACQFSGTVAASETVADSLTVGSEPVISVETFNGRIGIVAGGDETVEVRVGKRGSGTSQAEAEADLRMIEVTIVQDGDRVTITARRIDDPISPGNSGADVELTVPRGSSLDLRTSNGRVEAANVAGPIVARSSNGAVIIRDSTDVDAETTNGPLTVTEASGRLQLRTSNGAVDLIALDEAVVTVQTSNGAINLSGTLAEGEHRMRTTNAAVRISLPASAEFIFEGHTSNANITTDFEGLTVDNSSLTGTVGVAPGTDIRADTSNGDLAVVKQP